MPNLPSSTSASDSTPAMAAPYPQIVLFGDSLFQGALETQDGFSLQSAMSAYCARRYDVVNRGLSGYNTSQALKILPDLFPLPKSSPAEDPFVPKIAYLIILLGANDAALSTPENNQHVGLVDYGSNLESIITHPNIVAHNPEKIIVVTPPPVDGIRLADYESLISGYHRPASRLPVISVQYSGMAREVGESFAADGKNVVVVDFYKVLMDLAIKRTPDFDPNSEIKLGDKRAQRGYLANLLTDGLHLTAEAYRILWDELKAHIPPPSTDDKSEGYVYPSWRVAPGVDDEA